jgi:hypothetical protein
MSPIHDVLMGRMALPRGGGFFAIAFDPPTRYEIAP